MDNQTETPSKQISRRGFLGGMVAGAALLVFGSKKLGEIGAGVEKEGIHLTDAEIFIYDSAIYFEDLKRSSDADKKMSGLVSASMRSIAEGKLKLDPKIEDHLSINVLFEHEGKRNDITLRLLSNNSMVVINNDYTKPDNFKEFMQKTLGVDIGKSTANPVNPEYIGLTKENVEKLAQIFRDQARGENNNITLNEVTFFLEYKTIERQRGKLPLGMDNFVTTNFLSEAERNKLPIKKERVLSYLATSCALQWNKGEINLYTTMGREASYAITTQDTEYGNTWYIGQLSQFSAGNSNPLTLDNRTAGDLSFHYGLPPQLVDVEKALDVKLKSGEFKNSATETTKTLNKIRRDLQN